jgi:hypothetical protein
VVAAATTVAVVAMMMAAVVAAAVVAAAALLRRYGMEVAAGRHLKPPDRCRGVRFHEPRFPAVLPFSTWRRWPPSLCCFLLALAAAVSHFLLSRRVVPSPSSAWRPMMLAPRRR